MREFVSAKFLEPGRPYIRAERAGFVGSREDRAVVIGPFDHCMVTIDRELLLVGFVAVARMTDERTWLIDVDGEVDEFDFIETFLAPISRGARIGDWEGYLQSCADHDHALGR